MLKIKTILNQKTLFMNTFIMIIVNFIIKILGLLYRVIITRFLYIDGMALYILIFPTLLLFITIASCSMSLTISKLVSENYVDDKNKYFVIEILKKGIKFSLFISFITCICFLLTKDYIIVNLLKNKDLTSISYTIIPLIFLVGISDALRGFFIGLKDVKTSSLSMLIEQLGRIFFTTVTIIIYQAISGNNIKLFCALCLLSQSFGEILSIIYTYFKLKKLQIYKDIKQIIKNKKDYISYNPKPLYHLAITTTLTKLLGNISYFFEPIIYTFILLKFNYPKNIIDLNYTIFNAFVIPLLTICTFFSLAISSSCIPHISSSYKQNDIIKVHTYFERIVIYSLLIAIFFSIILYFYNENLMLLLYNTKLGCNYVKKFIFIFIIYYLHLPLVAFSQSINLAKTIFTNSLIFNFLRLILIIILAFILKNPLDSIIYAIISTSILSTLVYLYLVIKKIKYQISYYFINNLINLILLFVFCLLITYLLSLFNLTYLIAIFIIGLIFSILTIYLKIIKFPKIL